MRLTERGLASSATYGEPAPGPAEWRLRLPPAPATLAALPYFAYHPFGVEQRRAELIRRVAARAAWFEEIIDMPLEQAYARLRSVPGIGPWTAAEVGVRALGDEDAVSVGDFHLPHLVSFALAGEPRGSDARMLELLEPYRGQRARVVRLLEMSGLQAPRLRTAARRPAGSRTARVEPGTARRPGRTARRSPAYTGRGGDHMVGALRCMGGEPFGDLLGLPTSAFDGVWSSPASAAASSGYRTVNADGDRRASPDRGPRVRMRP